MWQHDASSRAVLASATYRDANFLSFVINNIYGGGIKVGHSVIVNSLLLLEILIISKSITSDTNSVFRLSIKTHFIVKYQKNIDIDFEVSIYRKNIDIDFDVSIYIEKISISILRFRYIFSIYRYRF